MTATIYKPAKTAMQSGSAQSTKWLLVHDGKHNRSVDPLMGWTSTSSTEGQVRLEFASLEDAIAYAERNGLPYRVVEPTPRRPIRKSYSDNFRFGRVGMWTH